MRHVLMGLVGAVGLLVGGCSTTDGVTAAGGSNEGVGQEQSPIFKGTADTTHQAVVALYKQSGNAGELCTGTIIARNGSKAFVLTAAHCIADGKPDVVLLGNDIDSQSVKSFTVSDAKAHPSYSKEGGPYDFAMVTFTGASASTPVIPAMTKENDNLAKGSTVTFVGYGRTETNNNNSVRNKVAGTLSNVTTIQVQYSQGKGGPCNGDSGGPSLTTVNGTELVSSVTSYGDENCTIEGVSGRVSAVYDSFIKPYIDGTSATLTCDECQSASQGTDGACASAITACQNDKNCAALGQCLGQCSDATCQQDCFTKNSAGQAKYSAIGTCICDTACPTECAAECKGPTCGLSFQNTTCNSCSEGKCCDSSSACAGDKTCLACLDGTETDACKTNAAFKAFGQCLTDSCSTECGIASAQCAYDFSGIGADCGTCADGGCCDEQKTCADDVTCNACVTDKDATGCDTSGTFKTLFTCLQNSCATQCGLDEGTGGSSGTGSAGTGSAGTGGSTEGGGGTKTSTGGSSSNSTGGKGGKGGKAGSSTDGSEGGAAGNTLGGLFGGSADTVPTNTSSSGGCSAAPTPASSSPLAALALGLVAVASRRRRQG